MERAVIGWEDTNPVPEKHAFTEYLRASQGSLLLDGLDLYSIMVDGAAGNSFKSPLEVVYLPIIRDRIKRLREAFGDAIAETGYGGEFIYTYASKANAAEEVIRTILSTGVNLEISSWVDVEIASHMRERGLLGDDRLVISNGFKQPGSTYAEKLLQLQELRGNVIPVIEDPVELKTFIDSGMQFDVGLRLKSYGKFADVDAMDAGNSRFGMDISALMEAAATIEKHPNLKLRLFHAMVGSQITDAGEFVDRLTPAIEVYARLREQYDSLKIFDFGGGVPVQQTLDFTFDYKKLASLLLQKIGQICGLRGVPLPDVMGEMGRYTAAEHGAHIFKVAAVKDNKSDLPWYVINGSIMTSFPDTWALGENFIVLPLNHLDQPFQQVQLGGITCDSDDIFPSKRSKAKLYLPKFQDHLYVGFFNIGAYQEMLGGAGGSKHCVIPEADELVVDKSGDGSFEFVKLNGQTSQHVLRNLGYR
jgi:arginine decarboxylase